MPWYVINPIAAKGAAPRIHIQLRVSTPKLSFSRRYSRTAIPTAAMEKKNCRMDSPKNIVSL